MNSSAVSATIILLCLWSLFGDGIRFTLYTKAGDLGFDIITGLIVLVLTAEILANCYCRDEYLCLPTMEQLAMEKETTWRTWIRRLQVGSFYFWLDSVSTVALLIEVRRSLEVSRSLMGSLYESYVISVSHEVLERSGYHTSLADLLYHTLHTPLHASVIILTHHSLHHRLAPLSSISHPPLPPPRLLPDHPDIPPGGAQSEPC